MGTTRDDGSLVDKGGIMLVVCTAETLVVGVRQVKMGVHMGEKYEFFAKGGNNEQPPPQPLPQSLHYNLS